MMHLTGWYESVDQAGAAADIAAIADETLYTNGDIIRVPPEISKLVGVGGVTAATTFTSAQLQSPSLRTLANKDVIPFGRAATFTAPPPVNWFGSNPLELMGDESLTFNTNTDHASAIGIYGLIWLSDAAVQPINGEIFTVRCTAGITLAAGTWVNGNLTFTQDLPFGDYAVVGIRAESTNLVAGRLVFPGGRWRPGVPGTNAPGDNDFLPLRAGNSGVLGSFNSNSPPSVDLLGVTDTSETIYLDLIKTG